MKAKIIWTAALLLVCIGAYGETQQPITVGVLTVAGPRRTMANNLTSLLTAYLSTDQRFILVERDGLDKMIKEQSLGLSGNINPESAAKIGQLSGAKVLVSGREFTPNNSHDVVLVVNIIGTETGRVFSQIGRGSDTNLVALTEDLCRKIADTVVEQATNLLGTSADVRKKRLEEAIAKLKDKKLPAVSIKISEKISGERGSSMASETEFGATLQKAHFTVVDEKSDTRPDVVITGDAVTGDAEKRGELFSSTATIHIKAQERQTGKILALDLQHASATDISKQAAARKAIENAADELLERLLPALAQ